MKGVKGFTKGVSGNPHGRPSTSATIVLRGLLGDFLESELPIFLNEVKAMRPGKVKSDTFLGIMAFVLPKINQNQTTLNIDKLSDEEALRLLNLAIEESGNQENT